jgi:hydroxylamine dehydrogenase
MTCSFLLKAKIGIFYVILFLGLFNIGVIRAGEISETTESCIDCHTSVTPGIVADWQNSRHAHTSIKEAMAKPEMERRISATDFSDSLTDYVVGCAECHMVDNASHSDTFNHNDYNIHTIVSPPDCATCHPVEWSEYQENIMSKANINLTENSLYVDMINSVNGLQHFTDNKMVADTPDDTTEAASCLACHGTRITVNGLIERETDLGEMSFPVLMGWPNQGVGRINPDGSMGSCTSCHARHQFSIEMARKPASCSECHKGPDVPAYKVYQVSKHGNIYSSLYHDWNFENVPWTIGADFDAPTCAVCHMSLLVDKDETVIAHRTHRVSDRLSERIFGLIYAHPYPIDANTSIIRNKAGLPLPTELTGAPASEFLIDKTEQKTRLDNMKSVCRSCHSSGWVDGHFVMLDKTIETTDAMTLSATELMLEIWKKGYADGLPQGKSIFDEAIEKQWVEQWLFFANSTRFSAAMAGADYGVFANGRWYLSKNLRDMYDWLEIHNKLNK